MRLRFVLALLGLAAAPAWAALYPPLQEVGIHFPELVSKSSFVCKGEITSAPKTTWINGPLPRKTGIATFRIDTCFKGKLAGEIDVLADEYLPDGGWGGGGHVFIPKVGEYLLLFLNRKGGVFDLADENRNGLPVSRLVSTQQPPSDPSDALEQDFEAGVHDPNPELVMKSILWLGCMQHLRSTAALHALLPDADNLEELYIWEALLKVGDTTVIPNVAEYLDEQPPVFRPLSLPADRLLQLNGRVFVALCAVRDPVAIPYLTHLTESSDAHIRVRALMGLRTIGNLRSAPVFLRELDDHHEDMDFIAMQALFELAGGGQIDWVPSVWNFPANAAYYAERCREWWATEGEAKAQARFSTMAGIKTR